MLYNLAIYQVISCSISLLTLLYYIVIAQEFRLSNIISYILSAVFLVLALCVLYLNTEYLTKRKLTLPFKWANQWFNFAQLLNFSILGVTFYFLSGPAIIPQFIYTDQLSGDLLLNFTFIFKIGFTAHDSHVAVGINLVSVLYLYLFHHAIRKAETAEKFELDLFKPKSNR